MNGIYGISDPGNQLKTSELASMSLAMDMTEGQHSPVPLGEKGVLVGTTGSNGTSLISAHGCLVAVDADLCNELALWSAYEKEYREAADSTANVIAALYQRYGLDCVDHLDGAFAFTLWDPLLQRLVLAVDRHGFKTLYWSQEKTRMVFASRLDSVAGMRRDNEVNAAAVMQLLIHSAVPAPLTIYHGIERLEPGTLLIYQGGATRKVRYWDLNYDEKANVATDKWSKELQECMREAVHAQLEGCRQENTGAYLSGGTDSSSVVAFASELLPRFNTFSIYFDNARYDEVSFARTAAECFHTSHHEKCLQAADAVAAIPKLIEYYDEPFANSSAIGAYHCALLARERGVDTLLAGDGGDELFAGNERYAADKKFALYQLTPEVLRNKVIKAAIRYSPKAGLLSLPARYVRRAEVPNPARMFSYNFFLNPDGLEACTPEFLTEAKPESAMHIARTHFDSAPGASSDLNRLLYLDVKMTLSDNDIRKVTGTADLAGVKVRFPLLDRRLAELSGRIPSALKLKGFEKRYIFKQAMKKILPDKILYKKKHGFGVPLGYWLTHDADLKDAAERVFSTRISCWPERT
jgi:asparagine synthase (glutamine-hydrolysing)